MMVYYCLINGVKRDYFDKIILICDNSSLICYEIMNYVCTIQS